MSLPFFIKYVVFFSKSVKKQTSIFLLANARLFIKYNTKKEPSINEGFPYLFIKCGRWDLNPHDIAATRSLVLLVCQFRHFRISLDCSRDDFTSIPRNHLSVKDFFHLFLFFLFSAQPKTYKADCDHNKHIYCPAHKLSPHCCRKPVQCKIRNHAI